MPRVRTIQHSINSGEWSPRLEGRSDIQKYNSALKTCENFIALKYGGASRRPGTRYVAEVKTSGNYTRLMPFQFSVEQAFMLEVGDQYMRFYKDGGRIESPPGTPVELVTPYLQADVFGLNIVQSADVIYIAHRSYAPRKLSRTSDTSWALTAIDFADGPYLDQFWEAGDAAITMKASANTGTGVTLTASSARFVAGHVGSIWRIKGLSAWGYVKVTAYTSTTQVTVTVVNALDFATPGVSTTTNWQEGAWSAVRGYPGVNTLFQQRLWWGSTDEQPDSFWGSVSNDYENQSPGSALASDALNYTLASNAVNQLRWMAPSRALLIGTAGQEWQVTSAGAAIAADDTDAKAETTYGSSSVAPLQVHNAALFLQRTGKILREYSYDLQTDAYTAPDLTLLAEHLTRKYAIIQLAYQQVTDSIVWAVRADGQLLGLTYDRVQDVVAWHRHIAGGSYPDGLNAGSAEFHSVAVIPHPDGDRDQVWVIVRRTINSVLKDYVEYLDDKNGVFASGLNTDAAVISSTYLSGTDTITGLNHLEGETVDIVAVPFGPDKQPAVYPSQVVSGGQITGLSPKIYTAEIGLHYDSDLLTLKPEIPRAAGTSQGQRKRYNEIIVRLDSSLGGLVNGESLSYRNPSDPMDSGPSLVSDDFIVKNVGWDRSGRIRVQQTQPLPFTVLCIIGTVNAED